MPPGGGAPRWRRPRRRSLGAWLAGRDGGGGGRGLRRRRADQLPARRPQNADGGFGSSPGAPSSPALRRLGGARARRRGARPAERPPRRQQPARLHPRRASAARSTWLARADDPRRARGRGVRAPVRRPRPRRPARRRHPRRRLDLRPGQPDRVRGARAARCGRRAGRANALRWLIRQQDPDGGFNFASAGGASDVDDTGAALEALAGAPGAGSARSRGVRFLRRQQNRDGGFPALAGRALQRPVDGVGDPGPGRGRASTRARSTAAGPCRRCAYLQSLARARRARPLLAHERSDAGVGDRQALMALAGKPLPVGPVRRRTAREAVAGGSKRRGSRHSGCRRLRHRKAAHQAGPGGRGSADPNRPCCRYAERRGRRDGDRARAVLASANGRRACARIGSLSPPDADRSPEGDRRRRAPRRAGARGGAQARGPGHEVLVERAPVPAR